MTGTCLPQKRTERLPAEPRRRLPRDLRARLRPGEAVRYFAGSAPDTSAAGGVTPRGRWLLVTDERVLFGGTSAGPSGPAPHRQHESGSISLPALSGILVTADKEGTAAGGRRAAALRLTSGGVETLFALASVDEAVRLQALLEDLRQRPRAIRASGATARRPASRRTGR